jgi:hypothetical protein
LVKQSLLMTRLEKRLDCGSLTKRINTFFAVLR